MGVKAALVGLLVIASFAGCFNQPARCDESLAPPLLSGRVSFAGGDGFRIVGEIHETPGADVAVVMAHGLNEDRRSFAILAGEAVSPGFTVLAYDQRAHGESNVRGGCTVGIEDLTAPEFTGMIDDARLAAGFVLRETDATAVLFVGASIGANAVMNAATLAKGVSGAALISPGLNYHGIRTDGLSTVFPESVALLIQTSANDTYSNQSSGAIAKEVGERATLRVHEGSAHGTELLLTAAARRELVDWMVALSTG